MTPKAFEGYRDVYIGQPSISSAPLLSSCFDRLIALPFGVYVGAFVGLLVLVYSMYRDL